ncbi:MAG: hypothetical protein HN754_04580, partial [Opitutae bacterium]|nr:hypothetical protein [Opitutae bacterium]
MWASEPVVQNPIAMVRDTKGRIWVAKNYNYVSRKVRFDLGPLDRLIVVVDEGGDVT